MSADQEKLDQLARAAARGNQSAFRRLYRASVQRVHRQVGRMLGWGPEVEDVVQDVFLEIHRSLPRFREEAAFGTWLFRITRNVAVSYLRRRGSRPVDLSPIKALSEAIHQPNLDAREQVRALYAALDQVAPESREAFVLYELEGLTLSTIAEVTGDPLNTVASRVRRTRERLRRLLERGRGRRRRAR